MMEATCEESGSWFGAPEDEPEGNGKLCDYNNIPLL